MVGNSGSKPYYLSVLAIFKNETLNLKLWLDHYIWQGVDHFFLIDNGSTDDFMPILQEYIDRGFVTCRSKSERYAQVNHYRAMYIEERIQSKTHWLAIVDLDEFVFGLHRFLRDVLVDEFEDRADIVQMNWYMFGTHLDKHPSDLRVALTYRAREIHGNTKVIFQTDAIWNPEKIHIHWVLGDGQFRKHVENHSIRLYHYPLQSLEYFQAVKMSRGDVYNIRLDSVRNMTYFESMKAAMTQIEDDTLANLVQSGYPPR